MSKHTPGPWKFNPILTGHRGDLDKELGTNRRGYLHVQTDEVYAGDTPVCRVFKKDDAPIIACAPEMLEVLIDLERTNGKANALWDKCRNLIAKAGGRK